MRAAELGLVSWDRVVALGDIIGGVRPGRTSADQIIVCELQGIGIEDVAVAELVVRRATRAGRRAGAARLMKYQPRVKKPAVKAAPGTVSAVHPVDVPRAATGSKGDAWVVSLPAGEPAPGVAVLAFDTGRDSTTIVIGDVHGPVPRVHPGHDLGIVVPAGSGELRHGDAPGGPGRRSAMPGRARWSSRRGPGTRSCLTRAPARSPRSSPGPARSSTRSASSGRGRSRGWSTWTRCRCRRGR